MKLLKMKWNFIELGRLEDELTQAFQSHNVTAWDYPRRRHKVECPYPPNHFGGWVAGPPERATLALCEGVTALHPFCRSVPGLEN